MSIGPALTKWRGMSDSTECLFCKIIAGVVPTKRVLETPHAIVISDIHPKAPIHYLILPKLHAENPTTLTEPFLCEIKTIVKELLKNNLLKDGYRLIINSGPNAGQEINHVHIHVLGGKRLGPLC